MASNTLINKLTEECNKCQKITDQNTTKINRFEGDSNDSHQSLVSRMIS